ncbi:MAG TPA: DPP IV N-terminal domain-containing protein [Bacteroidales bacterium]|nr:DPP IV N-terminal domain-containing protein [Bacteroidales bacterium]
MKYKPESRFSSIARIMINLRLVYTAFLLLFITQLRAQDQLLTPEDAAGTNFSLFPRGLSQLQWTAKPGEYTWQSENFLLRSHATTSRTDTILTLPILNKSLISSGFDSLKRVPQLQWLDPEMAVFRSGQNYFLLNFNTMQTQLLVTLPPEAENPELHSASRHIAYTIGNNIFVYDGTAHHQVTNEPPGIECGKTVHRNEFGINKGLFWSPDGTRLAFYRMDESMVTEYPLVDISPRIAQHKPTRYPMAGMTSHQVTIGIYDLDNHTTVYLQTGEPADQYLTAVSWHPDGKSIYTGLLNREQNHLKMNRYATSSGAFQATIFEEKSDTWVEPLTPLYFLPDNSGRFVWPSLRDGYNHLYLYEANGRLLQQLTSGPWMVTEVIGFDSKASQVFFLGTNQSPLEQNLHAAQLSNGRITLLSTEGGQHRVLLSADGRHLIDMWSNLATPRKTILIDGRGRLLKELHTAENPLKNLKVPPIEMVQLKADDQSILYGRLIKPIDFNPARKYPVIVYVYGGPHAQLVTNSWLGGANLYLLYLAQKGYVVFTLDNRGSANRGKAFEHIIHRRLGEIEMKDQLVGIEYLKALPFVDETRIGVDGWSYGGFMSTNLKLNHPHIFKVATAGGPVTDWKYYEIMYGERYMDSPEENPEGYKASSLLNQAGKLEGRLMIIHGDMDDVVVMQHSLALLKRFVEEMKLVDFFVYTGHPHNVRGRDRTHLIRKITDYFDQNL